MDAQPGTVIAERYRLDKVLGEGGFGTVWAATHTGTDKRVAIKVLKTAGKEEVLRRFRREAKAVSAVNHPNVVAVHDIFNLPDGEPAMVMDLLSGQDLGQRLADAGRLDLGETARILTPILSAVGAAHAAGIVHRDLKPDNIFLHVRGDGEAEPKVLDFGIAKLTGKQQDAMRSANLTQTGAVLGTPYYMSPEQVFGERDLDHRADVWAMGVIIYECLAGKRPYDGENFGQLFRAITVGKHAPLAQLVPDLPSEVTDLVESMLRPDRAERLPDLTPAFELLRKHGSAQTTVRPPAFGPPVSPAVTPSSNTPLDPHAPQSGADSVDRADRDKDGKLETKDGFSRTGSARVPMKRSMAPYAVAAAVGVGGIAVGVFALRSSGGELTPGAETSAQLSTPSDTSPVPTPPTPATATSSPAAVDAGVDARARDIKKPRRPVAVAKPRAKPAPTPPASAAPTATAAPTETKLPGNVVGKAPF